MTDKKPKTCSVCGFPHYAKGLCKTHYSQRPERKAYKKAYSQRPERKAHMKAYHQRPEAKAYMKAYHQRPEVKAHKNAKIQTKKIVREYQALMLLKNPSRLAMLRLEALAEILGRDLEEWRTEEQKKVWI